MVARPTTSWFAARSRSARCTATRRASALGTDVRALPGRNAWAGIGNLPWNGGVRRTWGYVWLKDPSQAPTAVAQTLIVCRAVTSHEWTLVHHWAVKGVGESRAWLNRDTQ